MSLTAAQPPSRPKEIVVSETHEERIAREEAYWNGPRLFAFGLVFLAICLVFIYIMASI
jgi:hypothetical protein